MVLRLGITAATFPASLIFGIKISCIRTAPSRSRKYPPENMSRLGGRGGGYGMGGIRMPKILMSPDRSDDVLLLMVIGRLDVPRHRKSLACFRPRMSPSPPSITRNGRDYIHGDADTLLLLSPLDLRLADAIQRSRGRNDVAYLGGVVCMLTGCGMSPRRQ